MANDLAYVVQAVVRHRHLRLNMIDLLIWLKAPNFVWKTTDFPRATKGYLWSIILTILSS